MDDVPICPDWWPRMLWHLHFPPKRPGPGPGPINYPPAIDSILAALTTHTLTYMYLDKEAAQQVRTVAERTITQTAQKLSRLHAESLAVTPHAELTAKTA
jgi:hypothetical protein